jgi:3-phytase
MKRSAPEASGPAVVEPPTLSWKAAVASEPVGDDPDDPAIWIHPNDPAQSIVVATNKTAAPAGSIVVFDLTGKILQTISGIDRPNNVDIRQNVALGGRAWDLAVATERYKNRLRIFAIDAKTRRLSDLAAPAVFEGETGDLAAPMGIALYRRASDGALFAIVGRKSGPAEGYLWQYRVEEGGRLRLVRKFGRFSGEGEIEAIVADDEAGFVYYADEGAGIRKYHADPDAPDAGRELALFGTSGYRGDREGLAIYRTGPSQGYLISTDQIAGGSRYLLYDRANPSAVLAVIEGGADETDGIEVTSTPLGAAFPHGLLVTMNSGPRNFLFFAWQPVQR